jgi:polynucleotide 5'-kinase involved in rRNA processing
VLADPLPPDWRAALDAAAAARRVLVIGAADMGKSHFVRLALAAGGGAAALVDLDPGQKMVGAPGTLGIAGVRGGERGEGRAVLERFVFTGSTSPVYLRDFLPAARRLVRGRRRRVIVNTPGLVAGLGVRLQRMTIAAVRPDLIVAIAEQDELAPILVGLGGIALAPVRRSAAARRKSPAERRRARQEAFGAALAGPERRTLPAGAAFSPAPPAPFTGAARPVCALAGADGRHRCIGVVEAVGPEGVTVLAPPHGAAAAAGIVLGRMWAEPAEEGWHLLERLEPSWGG